MQNDREFTTLHNAPGMPGTWHMCNDNGAGITWRGGTANDCTFCKSDKEKLRD